MSSTLRLIDGIGVALLIFLLFRLSTPKRRIPLPPGPKGLPWIGNAFSWPRRDAWAAFVKWGEIYGPVLYFKVFGSDIIVLNSAEAVSDLLDHRGAIYSDRPIRPVLDAAGMTRGITMSSYTTRVQRMRRMVTNGVGGKAGVARFADVLSLERHRLLRRLLENPGNLQSQIRTTTASVIIDVDYGLDISGENDPILNLMVNGIKYVTELIPLKGSIADVFPFLRYLPSFVPGAKLYKIAAGLREHVEMISTKPYAIVKQQLAAGTARPSYTAIQLDDPDLTPEKEELIRYSGSTIFNAGHETLTSAIYNFFIAMMLYPEVQARAQQELDAVIGHERLPELNDRAQLPYTSAIMKEVLRWAPPISEGLPHRLREDDVYMGYHIPKNASIIGNVRGILSDSRLYSSPSIFEPARFLGAVPERDPADFAFGFGRRICPGLHFAEASLFLNVSAALAVFTITQTKGTPPIDRLDRKQVPSYPAHAPIHIAPRSETARMLINAVAYRGEETSSSQDYSRGIRPGDPLVHNS